MLRGAQIAFMEDQLACTDPGPTCLMTQWSVPPQGLVVRGSVCASWVMLPSQLSQANQRPPCHRVRCTELQLPSFLFSLESPKRWLLYPGQARALTDWDTMSDKEMLRRCLGLPREVSDEDFMLALRSRIEAKKKNFSISEDNEEVRLPKSVRLEVKVLPSDTAVYLDQRTRSGVKNVHVLEPQGGGWTWRQAQHRARPEVNIAFEKEARPQLALIFLRPWRRTTGPGPRPWLQRCAA